MTKKSTQVAPKQEEAVVAPVAKPAKKDGVYLDNEKIIYVSGQPLSVAVKWDDKANIRNSGEYKNTEEYFPAGSKYLPVNFKDFGNRVRKGFVVRTPEEVMLWALESERT